MRQLVAGLLLLQGSGGTPAALLPPQVYSDQAILTSSLRKHLVGFCERRKTDYRCQKGAASMGMKALATVTPADLDNADLPLSDEEFAAMLDIAVDGLFERDPPTPGAERAERAEWPRLQLDDTGGAYWTTAKGQTPALGFGSWQKAGAWPRASCAVVGSGAALSGRGLGPEIDAHDVVVIVNNMPAKADHADMGSRMDVFFQSAAGILSQTGPTGARMVVSTGGHDPDVDPICHTSGKDEPRCIDRFKVMIVRNLLLDPPGWQNAHYMRDFANDSKVGLGWSGKMVTTLVHHLRRPGLPDEGKPSTGFHALVTMALLCSSVELCECPPRSTRGRTHLHIARSRPPRLPACSSPDRPFARRWLHGYGYRRWAYRGRDSQHRGRAPRTTEAHQQKHPSIRVPRRNHVSCVGDDERQCGALSSAGRIALRAGHPRRVAACVVSVAACAHHPPTSPHTRFQATGARPPPFVFCVCY